ncbi:ribonuclease H-like domain-containing protein [Tanacetum coccineum]
MANQRTILSQTRNWRSPVIDVGTISRIQTGDNKVMKPIKDIKGGQIRFNDGQEKQFDASVFDTGFRSTVLKWLKDEGRLFSKTGMPKHKSPNHWKGYEVDKYLRSPINETSASSLAPLTPEETKVDKIVLSWILFTLSDSLRARIVVARPKSAKEACSLISDIAKDNKRSHTNTLKAELQSIKLGDQSMESYFQKIDFIVNILTNLDARVNEKDVVHYALEGLLDTYNQVLALPVDSSSPMVLVAETSTISRSSTSQDKSWKPCFNFAKGSRRFGDWCRYVHDANARVSNANSGFNKGRETSENTTNDLLTKLLAQLSHLGMNVAMSNNGTNVTLSTHATVTGPNIASNVPTAPHAFYASPCTSLGPNSTPPPGFPHWPKPMSYIMVTQPLVPQPT